MIWLSNSTVVRLRDQLQARGQRPSIVTPEANMSPETVEMLNVVAEYGPLCEAMYLMMTADGSIGAEEREVLKGALRNLSGDSIRSMHIESMLDSAGKRVADEGREMRMKAVVESLHEDTARAEVAFVLAAAIAFADNAIADEENETLNELAEGLGIDEARANELLDDVEKDLGGQGAAAAGDAKPE
jgi:tellurite resistance protein